MTKGEKLLVKHGLDKESVLKMDERQYKLACIKLLDEKDIISVCGALASINYWRAQNNDKLLKHNNL